MRVAAVAAVVALATAGPAAQAKTLEVVIEHFAFVPASIEVSPGDSVVFVNRDIVPHTATATDGGWTTGDIDGGKSATVIVPDKAGGAFFCRYHPVMKGRLVVTRP